MKKIYYILIFISLSFLTFGQIGFGQRNYFYIKGKVTDQENPNKRIYGLKARVSFNDSLFIETDCDSLGNYSFPISRNFPRIFKTIVTIRQDKDILAKVFPPSKDCPFFSKIPDQYFTSDIRIISYKEHLTDFTVDFSIGKMIVDIRLPCIGFQKNSIELKKCYGDNPDTMIYCLKNILLQNPTIVVEIGGRAWQEKNQDKLSKQRAELVKQKLVSNGIDEQRIIITANGDKRAYISANEIKIAKTIIEKEELATRNRSIIFLIIAFDYDPILKKRTKL